MATNLLLTEANYCTVPKCTRKRHARGLCATHDNREKRGLPVDGKFRLPNCTLTDCGKKHFAHNLCKHHYQQWHAGILMYPRRPKYPYQGNWNLVLASIKESCEITQNECWLSNDMGQYKQLGFAGKLWQTHRLTWTIFYGRKPVGTLDHICRRPACCNPEHLEEVSLRDNMERMRSAQELLAENRRLQLILKENGIDYDIN